MAEHIAIFPAGRQDLYTVYRYSAAVASGAFQFELKIVSNIPSRYMVDVQDQSPVANAPAPPETTAATPSLSFRDGATYEGPVVPLAAFGAQSNTAAVRVDAGDDARALVPYLARMRLIEVSFPKYRDGRGYSSARILREAGYAGELRAVGDVLVDQIMPMRRVGFDSFAPAKPLDMAAVDRALSRYAHVYQKAEDGRPPVWALRHG